MSVQVQYSWLVPAGMSFTMGRMTWKPWLGSGAGPGSKPAMSVTPPCALPPPPPLELPHAIAATATPRTPTNLFMATLRDAGSVVALAGAGCHKRVSGVAPLGPRRAKRGADAAAARLAARVVRER